MGIGDRGEYVFWPKNCRPTIRGKNEYKLLSTSLYRKTPSDAASRSFLISLVFLANGDMSENPT